MFKGILCQIASFFATPCKHDIGYLVSDACTAATTTTTNNNNTTTSNNNKHNNNILILGNSSRRFQFFVAPYTQFAV